MPPHRPSVALPRASLLHIKQTPLNRFSLASPHSSSLSRSVITAQWVSVRVGSSRGLTRTDPKFSGYGLAFSALKFCSTQRCGAAAHHTTPCRSPNVWLGAVLGELVHPDVPLHAPRQRVVVRVRANHPWREGALQHGVSQRASGWPPRVVPERPAVRRAAPHHVGPRVGGGVASRVGDERPGRQGAERGR